MKMMGDRTSSRYLFDKKYKASLLTMEHWREGHAGAGFYGKNSDTNLTVPLGPHSTVLQIEIATILQCVRKVQDHSHGRNIGICPDALKC